jgi:GTP-binding protein
MLALADSVGVPTHVLLTKSDKLKRGQAANALQAVQKELADSATVQLFSAQDGSGCDEARAALERLFATGQ